MPEKERVYPKSLMAEFHFSPGLRDPGSLFQGSWIEGRLGNDSVTKNGWNTFWAH